MRNYFKFPVSRPAFGRIEHSYLNAALTSGQITQGPMVQILEEMLQKRFGRGQDAVVCSSGTAALHLALAAAGIGPGDEVLVPDMTYIATANAVTYMGATPVLVDIRKDSWTLDPEDCVRKLSNKTAAIIPVHLYGIPCNMAEIRAIADQCDLHVIEDAAEAFESTLGAGKNKCGTLGDYGCFSFYGNKLITTGEGGCVVTSDPEVSNKLRMLRGQGQSFDRKFYHPLIGFNYRMTDLQAAIGVAQMSRLDEFISERSKIFAAYDAALDGEVVRQVREGQYFRSPWLYTVLLPNRQLRDCAREVLEQLGIETRSTFIPLHRQPPYKRPDVQFPISSKIGDTGISLPTYVGLSEENAAFIAETLISCLDLKQVSQQRS